MRTDFLNYKKQSTTFRNCLYEHMHARTTEPLTSVVGNVLFVDSLVDIPRVPRLVLHLVSRLQLVEHIIVIRRELQVKERVSCASAAVGHVRIFWVENVPVLLKVVQTTPPVAYIYGGGPRNCQKKK